MAFATVTLSLVCATPAAAVDRLWRIRAAEEATKLRHGYSGSLRDAQSSDPEDKRRILEELESSGVEQEVNEAVEVLLETGMSTPSLGWQHATRASCRRPLIGA